MCIFSSGSVFSVHALAFCVSAYSNSRPSAATTFAQQALKLHSSMVGYKQKAKRRREELQTHHSHLAEYMVTGTGFVFQIDRGRVCLDIIFVSLYMNLCLAQAQTVL